MPILSQLDQNITSTDAFLSLKVLATFGSKKHIQTQKKFKNYLQDYFTSKVTFFDSGRSSLYAGLLALKHQKPKQTEVLVSAYTCVVVVNAILKAGLTPVYIDISTQNLNFLKSQIQKKVNSNTLAILIQNTFGITENYQFLTNFAQTNNLFLIEDLAHSIGSSYSDFKLGTYSDFAFLSFGSNKIITSSRGGAVITRDKKIHKFLTKFEQSLPEMPNKEVKKHLFKMYCFWFLSKFYFIGGKIKLAVLAKLGFFPKVIAQAEKNVEFDAIQVLKYPPQLSVVGYSQFKKLSKNLEHRQKISAIYYSAFINNPKIVTLKNTDQFSLMCFPILVKNPLKLYKKLLAKKIQLGLEWSKTNIVPSDINFKRLKYTPASCKNAETIAKSMIYLPTHTNISISNAQKIASEILKQI